MDAPVHHDTFMYWVMIACDPEVELWGQECEGEDHVSVRKWRQNLVHKFKARVFDDLSHRSDFMDLIESDARETADNTRSGVVAKRRKVSALKEAALRSMRSADFDSEVHRQRVIVDTLVRHTGIALVLLPLRNHSNHSPSSSPITMRPWWSSRDAEEEEECVDNDDALYLVMSPATGRFNRVLRK